MEYHVFCIVCKLLIVKKSADTGPPSLFWSGWSLVRLQLREKGGSGPESRGEWYIIYIIFKQWYITQSTRPSIYLVYIIYSINLSSVYTYNTVLPRYQYYSIPGILYEYSTSTVLIALYIALYVLYVYQYILIIRQQYPVLYDSTIHYYSMIYLNLYILYITTVQSSTVVYNI